MPRGYLPSQAGWRVLATLALPVFLNAAPDDGAPTPVAFSGSRDSASGSIRTAGLLLRSGHPALALKEVRESLETAPSDTRLLCLLGDIQFREADFDSAERAYRSALASDPESARAHWGLGRIQASRFLRAQAREEFSAAYRLDSSDPDILLAYAEVAPDRPLREFLLRRFLASEAARDDPARLGDIGARLLMEERIGERETPRLASPYRGYRFRLSSFFPTAGAPNGLLLAATINGGKPLRLVLDTGGSGIVLNRRALHGREIETLAQSRIGGLGSDEPIDARIALASTVAIDDFRLENVVIQVMDGSVVRGADGIIGTDVFQQFRLRLDPRAHVLDLAPYADGGGPPESSRALAAGASDPWAWRDRVPQAMDGPSIPAIRVSHFLLIRASLDGRGRYFMLDTGAAHSIVAHDVASDPHGRDAELRGAQGEILGYHLPPLLLKIGETDWRDPDPVAVDLHQLSHQQGVEISGAIGYSLLRRAVLTIDYRDGLVQLAEPRQ